MSAPDVEVDEFVMDYVTCRPGKRLGQILEACEIAGPIDFERWQGTESVARLTAAKRIERRTPNTSGKAYYYPRGA